MKKYWITINKKNSFVSLYVLHRLFVNLIATSNEIIDNIWNKKEFPVRKKNFFLYTIFQLITW